MADTDIWNLGGPIALAATVRLAAASAGGAGGYIPLSSLMWKQPSGVFLANGPVKVGEGASGNTSKLMVNTLNGVAAGIQLFQDGAESWIMECIAGSSPLRWLASGTERMRLTSGGRLGIGTNNPSAILHTQIADGTTYALGMSGTTKGIRVEASDAAMAIRGVDSTLGASFQPLIIGGSELIVHAGGAAEVGRFTGSQFLLGIDTKIRRNSGAVETAFTISNSNDGTTGSPAPTSLVFSGGSTETPTGRIQSFNAFANTVTTDMKFAVRDESGLINRWIVAAERFMPVADNGYALGGPSNRPNVIYAGSSTINTSDAREKKWRGRITDAELAAGLAVIDELGFYRWLDEIGKKGADAARFHFGARAQEVWRIFAEHKLVAPIKRGRPGKTPYAFLCWDKWGDEFEPVIEDRKVRRERPILVASKVLGPTGEPVLVEKVERYWDVEAVDTGKKKQTKVAGDRFGIRIDQLTLFLVACIDERSRREKAAADIRIEALEAALAELKKAA